MAPSIPLVCQACVSIPTDAQAGTPMHPLCPAGRRTEDQMVHEQATTATLQQPPCKRHPAQAKLDDPQLHCFLPSLAGSVRNKTYVLPRRQFGRTVCFREEEESQQHLRSREELLDLSAPHNQHSGISAVHSKEQLV